MVAVGGRACNGDLQLGAGRRATSKDGFQEGLQKVPRAGLDLKALAQCPLLMSPLVSLLDTSVMGRTVGSCHSLLLICVFLYQCQPFSCLALGRLSLMSVTEDPDPSCMWTPQLPCFLQGFSRFSQPSPDA